MMLDNRTYKDKICDGVGDKNGPKYMLVGMCGGRLGCIQTGVPFTRDGSGRLLIRVLNELGYTESFERDENPIYHKVYVTNLVKGVILDPFGNNREPNDIEIDYWRNHFLNEIADVRPRQVVAIGHLVYDAIKRMIDFGQGKHPLLLVRHPSYFLRNGALGKSTYGWEQMLNEYRNVLGYHDEEV